MKFHLPWAWRSQLLPEPAGSARARRMLAARLSVVLACCLAASVAATAAERAGAADPDRSADAQTKADHPRRKRSSRPPAETAAKPSEVDASQAPGAAAIASPPLAGREIYERLLRSAAFIACNLNEDWSSVGFGTGWLLDKQRRLIVTNHHVVSKGLNPRPERLFHVYFPEYKDGQLLTQRSDYIQKSKSIQATIVDTDPKRDLALLVLAELPEGVEELTLAAAPIGPGERVHQIGNPGASDALWVYTSGTVRQVYRTRVRLADDQVCDYLRVETQSPINPGDSGGPVVNDAGDVVAVNHAYGGGQLMTYFVDARELKEFLQEAEPRFDPQTAQQFNDRGVHYYDRQRYDKAIADFTQALKLDPKLADAAGNRGWALVEQDDAQTALSDFAEAIRMNPADANYWHGRGKAHVALGETSDAIKDFTEAIRLAPQQADLYDERADAYYEAEDYARAIKDYSQAIRLEPKQADYYNSRGVCQAARGDYAAAIADYSQAIEIANDPVYLYNRGLAKHATKSYEEAALDFFLMQRLDADYAKSQEEHFDRKVVRIRNGTNETLKVFVKYRTQTSDGEWKWFPADQDKDGWASYTFAPGEETFIEHDGFKINADRLRLFIHNQDRSHVWDHFRNTDYTVVPDAGYDGYIMEIHRVNIETN